MASLQGQAGFQGSLGCVQAQGHLLHALCAQLEEFLGEFPHLAKAEPSSSNTCSKALCCSKIASSTEGLRSVEPNDIYFWVLREEKAEKLHHRVLKTPGADWGQKPHHKLPETCFECHRTLHAVVLLLDLLCISSQAASPPAAIPCSPQPILGRPKEDFWPQENGLNLGSCVFCWLC